MSRRWDDILSSSSLRRFVGILFEPTDLFGFKLEMMFEINFIIINWR